MLLNVMTNTSSQAREIALDLLENKLIAQATIGEKEVFEVNNNHKLKSTQRFVVKGISKALLFDTINKRLRSKYPQAMPTLFAEPLIYIDPEQNENFLERIVKV